MKNYSKILQINLLITVSLYSVPTVYMVFLQMLPQCKLEGKYSIESTDPCESEIRAHLRP